MFLPTQLPMTQKATAAGMADAFVVKIKNDLFNLFQNENLIDFFILRAQRFLGKKLHFAVGKALC